MLLSYRSAYSIVWNSNFYWKARKEIIAPFHGLSWVFALKILHDLVKELKVLIVDIWFDLYLLRLEKFAGSNVQSMMGNVFFNLEVILRIISRF